MEQTPPPSCVFCFSSLNKLNERNLVVGRGDFNVCQQLQSLPFVVRTEISKYICRKCLGLLKKRNNLKHNLEELESNLFSDYRSRCHQRGITLKIKSPSKRWVPETNQQIMSVKPIKQDKTCQTTSCIFKRDQESQTDPLPVTKVIQLKDVNEETRVFVRAEWHSGAREKQLPTKLCSLGKMLVRGTLKQIAHAAWNAPGLQECICKEMLKSIHHECADLCSRSNPSILRKTTKEEILKFKFRDFGEELSMRAPLFHAVLQTASKGKQGQQKELFQLPTICMSAAICLKNRSHHMTAVQLIISIILKHSGISAAIRRLQATRITASIPFIHKKLDEFGKNFDEKVMTSVETECKRMDKIALAKKTTSIRDQPIPLECKVDLGRKMVFDNVDFEQRVHHMTEEHQNSLVHWTSFMSIENRVKGCHLQELQSQGDFLSLENGTFVPNRCEHLKQRSNYIHHASKIAVDYIPCLQPLKETAPRYINHPYIAETSNATNTTFHGIIYADENTSDGILRVLKSIQKYVPFADSGEERVYGEQGCVGDQLSVERAVNCLLQVSNGYMPEDRLEGMHFEAGDFHAGIKFMQVVFDNFYSGKSAKDPCTMFNDAALINRRNVGAEVKSRTSASKEFLLIELKSRVIAAFMEELQLESIDSPPSADLAVKLAHQKKSFLYDVSSRVVDKYILHRDKMELLLKKTKSANERERTMTQDGKYKCRHPDCLRVFKFDGKSRIDHEATHGLFMETVAKKEKKPDELFNYQLSLMEISMLIYNFFDAISMGDGNRVIQSWKFMLLYLKADGASSRKYALEGFYILSQYSCMLSQRSAFNLKWNRFFKSHNGVGGNIPQDLALEHVNRMLKNIFRMLGPNVANTKILDRYCKALVVNKALIEGWDNECKLIRKSGRHIKKGDEKDVHKIVKQLKDKNALKEIPGRRLTSFSNIQSSLIENLDIQSLFKWINEHKRLVLLKKVAR
eukprot:gene9643-10630_t